MEDEELGWQSPHSAETFEKMSIEEIEGYIARLEAEIDRARTVIGKKRGQAGAAEALFRK
ncbi:MAG: DUF1192 domain-containing protein [Alphaproteobacteria bacterium]